MGSWEKKTDNLILARITENLPNNGIWHAGGLQSEKKNENKDKFLNLAWN